MVNAASVLIGAAALAVALWLFARDCRGSVSPSMGGEMAFSANWNVGSIALSLGLLPIMHMSRWWALAAVPVLFALSFAIRGLVQKVVCVEYREEPTGFQRFSRDAEGRGKRKAAGER